MDVLLKGLEQCLAHRRLINIFELMNKAYKQNSSSHTWETGTSLLLAQDRDHESSKWDLSLEHQVVLE